MTWSSSSSPPSLGTESGWSGCKTFKQDTQIAGVGPPKKEPAGGPGIVRATYLNRGNRPRGRLRNAVPRLATQFGRNGPNFARNPADALGSPILRKRGR